MRLVKTMRWEEGEGWGQRRVLEPARLAGSRGRVREGFVGPYLHSLYLGAAAANAAASVAFFSAALIWRPRTTSAPPPTFQRNVGRTPLSRIASASAS